MSEMDPYARLEFTGELDPVMERVCDVYELGEYGGFEVVPVGYEDFNAVLCALIPRTTL